MDEEQKSSEELIAKDQGTKANPWPHPKPDYMEDAHAIILSELWREGLDFSKMVLEMWGMFPELKPTQLRAIVAHWWSNEDFRV